MHTGAQISTQGPTLVVKSVVAHLFFRSMMFDQFMLANILASQIRVKSGNFGQRVNSDIRLQTVKIQSKFTRLYPICWSESFAANTGYRLSPYVALPKNLSLLSV